MNVGEPVGGLHLKVEARRELATNTVHLQIQHDAASSILVGGEGHWTAGGLGLCHGCLDSLLWEDGEQAVQVAEEDGGGRSEDGEV